MEIKKIGYCFKAKLFALVSGNFRLKLFFNIIPIKFRQRKWICIKTGISGGVRLILKILGPPQKYETVNGTLKQNFLL